LLNKSGQEKFDNQVSIDLNTYEKNLLILLGNYKEVVKKAAETLSPAIVANFVYEVVKSYNSFYQNNPILNHEQSEVKEFRLQLSQITATVIRKSLSLLGIGTVNRM
jgi:arginyl-tRNA synthetase